MVVVVDDDAIRVDKPRVVSVIGVRRAKPPVICLAEINGKGWYLPEK